MATISKRLLLALLLSPSVLLVPLAQAQVQDFPSNYSKPVGRVALYEFTSNEFQTLSVVSGTWVRSSGTFNSTSATTAIATIDSYISEYEDDPPLLEVGAQKFWYRARMLNQRSGSSTRVGIVYHYQDPDNFTKWRSRPRARSSSAK